MIVCLSLLPISFAVCGRHRGTPSALLLHSLPIRDLRRFPIGFLVGVTPHSWSGRPPSTAWRQRHGVSILNVDVVAKRLELLHELVPTAAVIALLVHPTNPVSTEPENQRTREQPLSVSRLSATCSEC